MDEGSYSGALNKILQTARGPLTNIEDFEDEEGGDSKPKTEEITMDISEGRTNLRKLAALMAVLSIQEEDKDDHSTVGRQLGSAWAQDHRRTAMGLPGLAYSRAKRSTWR